MSSKKNDATITQKSLGQGKATQHWRSRSRVGKMTPHRRRLDTQTVQSHGMTGANESLPITTVSGRTRDQEGTRTFCMTSPGQSAAPTTIPGGIASMCTRPWCGGAARRTRSTAQSARSRATLVRGRYGPYSIPARRPGHATARTARPGYRG